MTTRIMSWIAILVALVAAAPVWASEKVYVYNWTEYLPDSVIEQFTKETGIEVVYSTYESNEIMYATLKQFKESGYDVVFPSTYFVHRMAREGMLQPLNHKLIPNMKDIQPALLNKAYDMGNAYSLPYMWGATGISVNSELIDPDTITSWKSLWDPQYKGKILLQDDMREVFHMALRIKGYSANSRNEKEIEEAYLLLKELMPNVLLFDSDYPRQYLLKGEVSLGMIWNGESWMAQQENPAIRFVYPLEGASFWVDNFVIPKQAQNVENAHKFIDFMLRPDIAKICVEENGFASPVKTVLPLLDEATRNSKTIFPDLISIARGEFQTDVGDALPIYQKYWEMLRAGN